MLCCYEAKRCRYLLSICQLRASWLRHSVIVFRLSHATASAIANTRCAIITRFATAGRERTARHYAAIMTLEVRALDATFEAAIRHFPSPPDFMRRHRCHIRYDEDDDSHAISMPSFVSRRCSYADVSFPLPYDILPLLPPFRLPYAD